MPIICSFTSLLALCMCWTMRDALLWMAKVAIFCCRRYPAAIPLDTSHLYLCPFIFTEGDFEFALCKGELKRAAAVAGVRVAPSACVCCCSAPPPPAAACQWKCCSWCLICRRGVFVSKTHTQYLAEAHTPWSCYLEEKKRVFIPRSLNESAKPISDARTCTSSSHSFHCSSQHTAACHFLHDAQIQTKLMPFCFYLSNFKVECRVCLGSF